jgi:methionine synthase II (cobalamin-independent)
MVWAWYCWSRRAECRAGQLKDKEELKRKVYDAANVIASGEERRTVEEALHQCVQSIPCPLSRTDSHRKICISPQCCFASHSEGNRVAEDDMRRKLALVVETAKDIWSGA